MLIPKTKKIRNKRLLQFVAEHPCALNLLSDDWCKGVIQAHHLLKPYDGNRGMGMKSGDNNSIPLCQYHHMLVHDIKGNEDQFWVSYGLDADFGRTYAEYLYSKFLRTHVGK